MAEPVKGGDGGGRFVAAVQVNGRVEGEVELVVVHLTADDALNCRQLLAAFGQVERIGGGPRVVNNS